MQFTLDALIEDLNENQVTLNTSRVWTGRARRGMTEPKLARRMGVSTAVIRSWEAEEGTCQITKDTLKKLAEVLSFPEGFFTHGNQQQDWEAHHSIRRQLERTEPGWQKAKGK